MSSSYKLLYQDRRQFVFEEFNETHTTAIVTLVAGFIAGSLLGVYFASLDATTAGSILLAVVTYVTVLTSTFSLKTKPISVLLIFVTSLGAVITLIYVSRVVLGYFSDSPIKLVLVFAAWFAVVAELIYLWWKITWVEDSRMHQLIESDRADGKPSPRRHPREIDIVSFFRWVLQILLFGILRLYYHIKGDASKAVCYPFLFVESLAKWPLASTMKPITIRNESLKRVKVCVYHRSDFCCWIPVGGITGGMYVLDRGDDLVFSPHWPDESFRVKIFADGVIDSELASHPHVHRGHRYTFIDVGKPITLLNSVSPPPSARLSLPLSSSEDEDEADGEHTEPFAVPRQPSLGSQPGSRGGLKRVASSRANLSGLVSSPASPRSATGGDSREEIILTPTSIRKTFKIFMSSPARDISQCISVLNETSTDVRVLFYNIEDTSFVIALDDFKVIESSSSEDRESNLLKRNAWKVFSYTGSKPKDKFCMRIRTAFAQTASNIELSFCTAVMGEALVVRDPLVSAA